MVEMYVESDIKTLSRKLFPCLHCLLLNKSNLNAIKKIGVETVKTKNQSNDDNYI